MAVQHGGPRHRLVFTGPAATVRLGYQTAATLGDWRVEDGYLSARVENVDGFRITQTPLVLEIPNKDGIPTRRPLEAVRIVDGHLSARLLPKRLEP